MKMRPREAIYENKWSFTYGFEWKINEQSAIAASKKWFIPVNNK